jgi:hypothetical protein
VDVAAVARGRRHAAAAQLAQAHAARLLLRGDGLSAVVMVRLLTSGVFFGIQSFLPLMLTGRGIT